MYLQSMALLQGTLEDINIFAILTTIPSTTLFDHHLTFDITMAISYVYVLYGHLGYPYSSIVWNLEVASWKL